MTIKNYSNPIEHESDLYRFLASCSIGDMVKFSGEFPYSKEDCLEECSITEWGSMEAPEFEIKFTSMSKLE